MSSPAFEEVATVRFQIQFSRAGVKRSESSQQGEIQHKHPYHPGLGMPVEVPRDGGIGQGAGWLKVPSRRLCASLVSRSTEARYALHHACQLYQLYRHTACAWYSLCFVDFA